MSNIDINSFNKHSRIYLFAEFVNKGIAVLILPFLTYLLSPSEYGQLSIYLAVTNLFVMFFGMNIYSALARRYHETDGDFYNFFGGAFTLQTIIMLVVLFIVWVFSDDIFRITNYNYWLFWYSAFVAILMAYLNFYMAYLTTSHQSKAYVFLSLCKNISISILSIIIILVLDNNKFFGKVYADMVVLSLLLVYIILKITKLGSVILKLEYIKYALKISFPMLPISLSGLVLLQADILILDQYVTSNEVGIYGFAYNVSMMIVIVFTAFNNAWIPIFYKLYNDDSMESTLRISKLVQKNFSVVCFLALLLILFSKNMISFIFDQNYGEAYQLIPIITFAFIFAYLNSLTAAYAMYSKKLFLISLASIFCAALNIFLNFKLIPMYGTVAAALTTLISYFLLSILYFVIVKIFLREDMFSFSKIIPALVFLAVTLFFNYYIFDKYNFVTSILNALLVLSLYVFLFLRFKLKLISTW